jgi:hypothetical protein
MTLRIKKAQLIAIALGVVIGSGASCGGAVLAVLKLFG